MVFGMLTRKKTMTISPNIINQPPLEPDQRRQVRAPRARSVAKHNRHAGRRNATAMAPRKIAGAGPPNAWKKRATIVRATTRASRRRLEAHASGHCETAMISGGRKSKMAPARALG